MTLRFDSAVLPNGYAWWYVDALSDDRQHGLALIAFIGSVFSPYYARARRRSPTADPANHCAMNVALYGGFKRWAMTERPKTALRRSATTLDIGPSSLQWKDGVLTATIEETTLPVPRRLAGVVRVIPSSLGAVTYALDRDRRHRWTPLAASARVEVELRHPALAWCGTGYLDTNRGDAALEDDFEQWHWSRAHHAQGTDVLYDATCRDSSVTTLALHFDAAGNVAPIDDLKRTTLPSTAWRIDRVTRCDAGGSAEVLQTFEDTPFYARSLISTVIGDQSLIAMHESLSLDRFRSRWVQALLPFRMPRVRHRSQP